MTQPGGAHALEIIRRDALYRYLLRVKRTSGAFRVTDDGEVRYDAMLATRYMCRRLLVSCDAMRCDAMRCDAMRYNAADVDLPYIRVC